MSSPTEPSRNPTARTAFLFDLDGTLVDSVYQHVLAWREALEKAGMELSVWRIHRRIGMSGGLLLNALLRETGRGVSAEQVAQVQRLHAAAYARLVTQVRPLPGAASCWPTSPRRASPGPSRPAAGTRAPARPSRSSGSAPMCP